MPSGFRFYYGFQPDPGWREWNREGSIWTESYPSAHKNIWQRRGPATVNGEDGVEYVLSTDPTLFAFVPNVGSPEMRFLERRTNGTWSFLGEMQNIQPASGEKPTATPTPMPVMEPSATPTSSPVGSAAPSPSPLVVATPAASPTPSPSPLVIATSLPSPTIAPAQLALEDAARERPWENTLGMKFVPIPGTKVFFGIWDTRVQDFKAFVSETDYGATEGMYSLGKDG